MEDRSMNRSDLPFRASLKLALLERIADDAEILARAVRDDHAKLDFIRDRLLNERDSSSDPDNDPRNQEIATLDAERQRLRDVQAVRMERMRDSRQLVLFIRDWMQAQKPNTKWEMAPPPDPALVAIGLNAIRMKILALSAELEGIEASCLPMPELQDRIKRYVADLARKTRPKLRFERGAFEVLWPAMLSPPSPLSSVPHPAAAFAAWLAPDSLYNALTDELEAAFPKDARAYGSEERVQRAAKIEAAMLELERAEEAAIGDRPDIQRRVYASPLAILGIQRAEEVKKAA
jgi:hypothetical protein